MNRTFGPADEAAAFVRCVAFDCGGKAAAIDSCRLRGVSMLIQMRMLVTAGGIRNGRRHAALILRFYDLKWSYRIRDP